MGEVTRRCGRKCEVYSRIVGYHRPVQNWNKGKKEEFRNRKAFNLSTVQQKLFDHTSVSTKNEKHNSQQTHRS